MGMLMIGRTFAGYVQFPAADHVTVINPSICQNIITSKFKTEYCSRIFKKSNLKCENITKFE